MPDRRVCLKIKIKSLAAEARIIKSTRAPKALRDELANHRRLVVRPAARTALLAYGFLRGRAYRQLEPTCERSPSWEEFRKLVDRYGTRRTDEMSENEHRAALAEQRDAAEKWIASAEQRA